MSDAQIIEWASHGEDFIKNGLKSLDVVFEKLSPVPNFYDVIPELVDPTTRFLYSDPIFSSQVLKLHLDETTDQASRRPSTISAHVKWFSEQANLQSILHPMCGPGLYARALLEQGHSKYYTGIDIGPATVAYARKYYTWPHEYTFLLADIFNWPIGPERTYETALLTYEALNAFSPLQGIQLLSYLSQSLVERGNVIIEVRMLGEYDKEYHGRAWEWHDQDSIFAQGNHIIFDEWGLIRENVFCHRLFVVSLQDHRRTFKIYHDFVWLYSEESLIQLVEKNGFKVCNIQQPFKNIDTDKPETSRNIFLVGLNTTH